MPQAGDVDRNLAGGKLSAFAGLRALRNFDFQFVGVNQIFRSDAESS